MAPHPTEPSLKHKAFGFVGSIFWISVSLLPLPIRWAVGSAIGSILYVLVGSRRRVVHRNLELCFPEKSKAERKQIARQTFRNAGRGVLSWGFGLFASQRRIDREVEWKGRDSFQSFIKLKRPVILLCPHFTAPMLTYRTIGSLTPAVSIYRRPRNPIFDMGYHCALTGVESPFPWLNKIYQRRGNHSLQDDSVAREHESFLQSPEVRYAVFLSTRSERQSSASHHVCPFFWRIGIHIYHIDAILQICGCQNNFVSHADV